MKKLNLTAPVTTFEYKSEYLPTKNKKIILRQCVNRDAYLLLDAQDTLPPNATKEQYKKAKEDREHAIKQFVQNCVIDDIDVGALPLFLIEDILLKIISASNSNIRDISGKCTHCNGKLEFSINLDDVKVVNDSENVLDKVYKLSDDIAIVLKMPTADDGMPDSNWTTTDFLKTCIESICNGDEVYYVDGELDISDFIDSMGFADVTNIMQNWYAKQPHIYH